MSHAHVYITYLTSGGKNNKKKNNKSLICVFEMSVHFCATNTVMYNRAV